MQLLTRIKFYFFLNSILSTVIIFASVNNSDVK